VPPLLFTSEGKDVTLVEVGGRCQEQVLREIALPRTREVREGMELAHRLYLAACKLLGGIDGAVSADGAVWHEAGVIAVQLTLPVGGQGESARGSLYLLAAQEQG